MRGPNIWPFWQYHPTGTTDGAGQEPGGSACPLVAAYFFRPIESLEWESL